MDFGYFLLLLREKHETSVFTTRRFQKSRSPHMAPRSEERSLLWLLALIMAILIKWISNEEHTGCAGWKNFPYLSGRGTRRIENNRGNAMLHAMLHAMLMAAATVTSFGGSRRHWEKVCAARAGLRILALPWKGVDGWCGTGCPAVDKVSPGCTLTPNKTELDKSVPLWPQARKKREEEARHR